MPMLFIHVDNDRIFCMSDIKLFCLTQGHATELHGDASNLKKPLQMLIENNLEPLLGIRFLTSEYYGLRRAWQ